jgi:hypothetical protein
MLLGSASARLRGHNNGVVCGLLTRAEGCERLRCQMPRGQPALSSPSLNWTNPSDQPPTSNTQHPHSSSPNRILDSPQFPFAHFASDLPCARRNLAGCVSSPSANQRATHPSCFTLALRTVPQHLPSHRSPNRLNIFYTAALRSSRPVTILPSA